MEVAVAAARGAGEAILRERARGLAARSKTDASPVTAADLAANRLILSALATAFPDDAILSEEVEDDGRRRCRERLWIVDPLDGTRDFVRGSSEFAVHIGLAVAGRPVLGVVFQPDGDLLYRAAGVGPALVTCGGATRPLVVSATDDLSTFRTGISSESPGDNLPRLLADSGLLPRSRRIGASIKLMAVAAGELEATLCLHGAEKEWDTCAPEAILHAAGGLVTDVDGLPLGYNQADVCRRRGIVASNRRRHDELCELARKYWE